MKRYGIVTGIIYLSLWIYLIGAWVVNLVKLINFDFKEPYRDEILHLIGVFIPPVSWVTAWL